MFFRHSWCNEGLLSLPIPSLRASGKLALLVERPRVCSPNSSSFSLLLTVALCSVKKSPNKYQLLVSCVVCYGIYGQEGFGVIFIYIYIYMSGKKKEEKEETLQFIGENERICVLRNFADKEAEQGKKAGRKL